MFCLLQLQRSYNSNSFATEIYKLSAEIRNKKLDDIKSIFEKYLLTLLADARGVKVQKLLHMGFLRKQELNWKNVLRDISLLGLSSS